ncbi:MAG: 30S ribosomal protein S2 [Planctomycetota bacterium]|nr:30S ribosomal protein S2 [Planctomycetota bacterium]
MPLVTVKELLESGVHFGHRTSRWNPKMKPYIVGKRNFIHIIDLKQTVRGIVTGCKAAGAMAARGETILFVGTKRAAQAVIAQEAQRCGMPYVVERWIGGTLTNFSTIRSRLKRLFEIEAMEADGRMELYGGKEQSVFQREKRKLLRNLDGIRTMERLPHAIFLVDPRREKNAIAEARKLGILTMSLLDTDGDPSLVDIPIPGNDDAMRVIHIVVSKLADSILAGKAQYVPQTPVAPATSFETSGERGFGSDQDRRRGRTRGHSRPGGGPGGDSRRGPRGRRDFGGPRDRQQPSQPVQTQVTASGGQGRPAPAVEKPSAPADAGAQNPPAAR